MYQNLERLEAANFNNYCRIRYEDLCESSFELVANIISNIDLNVDPDEIEKSYSKNEYRQGLDTPKSWVNADARDSVNTSVLRCLEEESASVVNKLSIEISGVGQGGFTTENVKLLELCRALGYTSLCNYPQETSNETRHLFKEEFQTYKESSKNIKRQSHITLKIEESVLPAPAKISELNDPPLQSLRILQGVTGQVNQPETIAAALRRRGHFSHSCTLPNKH